MSWKNIYGLCNLIEWRDSVNEKKKARAIQLVIDKKYNKLSKSDKIAFHHYRSFGERLSAW